MHAVGNLDYFELVVYIRTHRDGALSKHFAKLLGPVPASERKAKVEQFLLSVSGQESPLEDATVTVNKAQFGESYATVMSEMTRPKSIPAVMAAVLAKQGILGLFQGLGPELGRGVLSAALMLMVKEKLSGVVKIAVLMAFGMKKPA